MFPKRSLYVHSWFYTILYYTILYYTILYYDMVIFKYILRIMISDWCILVIYDTPRTEPHHDTKWPMPWIYSNLPRLQADGMILTIHIPTKTMERCFFGGDLLEGLFEKHDIKIYLRDFSKDHFWEVLLRNLSEGMLQKSWRNWLRIILRILWVGLGCSKLLLLFKA